MKRRIRIFAPATIANLGPGFDVLGLALSAPGDAVEAELSDRPGVEIVAITGDNGALKKDAVGQRSGGFGCGQCGRRRRGERTPGATTQPTRSAAERHGRRAYRVRH